MSETTYTSGLLTLDSIVAQALKMAKKPRSFAKLYYQLAIDAYRELRIHTVREGKKVIKATPSAIGAIDFPDELIDVLSVGVIDGGKIFLLTRNDDFITTTTDVEAVETQDSDLGEGEDIPNENIAGYYARGGSNSKGYYTVEYDKRRIRLVNVIDTTVFVGYTTSGTVLSGTTYVPVKYKRAIMAYMAWQSVVMDDDTAISRVQLKELSYFQARQELAESEFPTYDEIESALLSTFYATAKR